jgi:hypothetical protein
MAAKLVSAVSRFIADCPYVISLQDLVTKTRIELENGYIVDLYYNESLGKYAYTLILSNQRVVGWDNAPHHHPNLSNTPHHFHAEDGTVQPSTLTGDPEQDIFQIIQTINTIVGK